MFCLKILAFASALLCLNASRTRKCAYMNSTIDKSNITKIRLSDDDPVVIDGLSEVQIISLDSKEVYCTGSTNVCFTLWSEVKDSHNVSVNVILSQGCWPSTEKHDCVTSSCINGRRASSTKFCCCSVDYCNTNFTDLPFVAENFTDPQVLHNSYYSNNKVMVLFFVIFAVSTFIMFLIVYLIAQGVCFNPACKNKHCGLDSVHLVPNDHRVDAYTYEQLKLVSVIGQGRYGSVWKATVDNQEVAVKIFQSRNKQFFYNERDIYTLPYMDESFLLRYYGSDERIVGDNFVEYMLIFEHCNHGCLQDYLHCNTIDWTTFYRMVSSIAKGLAYLHNDIHKNGKKKPCVCHRDFNSRNILVRSDLECRICDFGLAVKIQGSRYYNLGEEQHAETQCINDAGTLRYMAPEILEGAVNLRDCEAALKQIDVYAFGLVLWELATRCQSLYQPNVEVPAYKLPFEAEAGLLPTFEKMQVLVSHNKARPLFPDLWRDTSITRMIRETIDDCWDQDAEARLTALCVEERMSEMYLCWDWANKAVVGYPNGISPTVNLTQSNAPALNCCNIDKNDCMNKKEGSKDQTESSASKETVESLISFSPVEPNETPSFSDKDFKNRMQQSVQTTALQPHQGRNPCIERNLMWIRSPSQENLDSPSMLVDRSSKHVPMPVANTEVQPLVQNDYLGFPNYSRSTSVPIPFVQNPVFNSAPSAKQCNIPKHSGVETESTKSKMKAIFLSNNFGWSSIKSCKLKNLSDEENTKLAKAVSKNSKVLSKTENIKKSESNISKFGKLTSENPSSYFSINLNSKHKKNNTSHSYPDTKVTISPFEEKNIDFSSKEFNISASKLEQNNKPDSIKQGSNSCPVLRPNNLSLVPAVQENESDKKGRQILDVFSDSWKSNGLKDLSKRIKTPGDVPPSVRRKGSTRARFSLYDDRIMIENEEQLTVETTEPVNKTNSFSVPIDINNCSNFAD